MAGAGCAVVAATDRRDGRPVAFKLFGRSTWRLFGSTGGGFLWDNARNDSVGKKEKEEIQAGIEQYASTHGISLERDLLNIALLSTGGFWVSHGG